MLCLHPQNIWWYHGTIHFCVHSMCATQPPLGILALCMDRASLQDGALYPRTVGGSALLCIHRLPVLPTTVGVLLHINTLHAEYTIACSRMHLTTLCVYTVYATPRPPSAVLYGRVVGA
jgi:hypothetical protein